MWFYLVQKQTLILIFLSALMPVPVVVVSIDDLRLPHAAISLVLFWVVPGAVVMMIALLYYACAIQQVMVNGVVCDRAK